jgi:hypothetical protein
MIKSIVNSADGKEIKLNQAESVSLEMAKSAARRAGWYNSPLTGVNAFADEKGDVAIKTNDDVVVGFDQVLTTLTAIDTEIAREKNALEKVSDFIDVVEGNGAWREEIMYFKAHNNDGDTLNDWRVDYAQHGAAKPLTQASVSSAKVPVLTLVKMMEYNRKELAQAMASGVWDPIREKEYNRRHNFDIVFQRFAMFGSEDGEYEGLLNISGVETDTGTAFGGKNLSAMTDDEFIAAMKTLFSDYYVGTDMTELPNRFILPEIERLKLATTFTSVASGFKDHVSRLEILEESLRRACGEEAKVLGSLYANAKWNNGYNQYVLYRRDARDLRIETPVPYTVYQGTSVDGWNYQNTAVAQISSVIAKRKKEIKYFKIETAV